MICCFKNDKKFGKFWSEHLKLSKFPLWLVPYLQSIWGENWKWKVMTLKSHAKFEEKLTCGLENDKKHMENFHQSTWKSQNWGLDGILLSKVENGFLLTKGYNIWVKKVQKIFVWWFWKLMQNLKVNWLLFSKITWGIWQTFTGWKIAISL